MFAFAPLKLPQRDREEANRASTSLELMFDLATAAAVAAAAATLARDLQAGDASMAITRFASNFFMTWLAWSNYTWFASGYDDNSAAFRAISVMIMFGALALAGGIHASSGDGHLWLVLIGFSVMRIGMIALWIGAANGDARARPAAWRAAAGIAAMQVYWNALIIALPAQAPLFLPLFALGAAGELALPPLTGRRSTGAWHHDHIVSRHNAFNIIVLGQCFATIALIAAQPPEPGPQLWRAALCAMITVSLWGLYFDRRKQLRNRSGSAALAWSYGHYFLFAAGAATATGFAMAPPEPGMGFAIGQSAALAIAVPIAIYCLALWFVRDRPSQGRAIHAFLPAIAALALAISAFPGWQLELTSALLAAAAIARRRLFPDRPAP